MMGYQKYDDETQIFLRVKITGMQPPAEQREIVSQRKRLSLGRIKNGNRRQPPVGLEGFHDALNGALARRHH